MLRTTGTGPHGPESSSSAGKRWAARRGIMEKNSADVRGDRPAGCVRRSAWWCRRGWNTVHRQGGWRIPETVAAVGLAVIGSVRVAGFCSSGRQVGNRTRAGTGRNDSCAAIQPQGSAKLRCIHRGQRQGGGECHQQSCQQPQLCPLAREVTQFHDADVLISGAALQSTGSHSPACASPRPTGAANCARLISRMPSRSSWSTTAS